VKKDINFSIIPQLSTFISKSFESLTISVPWNHSSLLFSSLYRPPSSDFNTFINHLENHLIQLSLTNHPAIILTDSNINILPLHKHHHHFPFYQIMYENGFHQCINLASRFFNQSFTAIDHIISNIKTPSINSGIILTDVSDHLMTFIEVPDPPPPQKSIQSPLKSNYSIQTLTNFKNALSGISWRDVLQTRDVNQCYDSFWDIFSPLLELYFPKTKVKFNKNVHRKNKFMTGGLLVSRATKLKLHKISILDSSPTNIQKYKTYRNLFNKILRASKKTYFESSLFNARKNPKKTWSIMKEALNINSNPHKIQKIISDGSSTSNPTEIAACFNKFFADAGKKVAQNLPPSSVTPESFLPQKNHPEFRYGLTSPLEICDLLKAFEPKKSNDTSNISMHLLKFVATEISTPLSHLFNLSLTSGTFPEKLKLSRVVPIYKSGKSDICDNYRPVGLQCNISKILEKFVYHKLTNHIELNKIIHPNQFGFQHGKNTEHNLTQVMNYISKAINEGDYCIGVFLDLKKAFDTVDHQILLSKLEYYGITGTELQWFKSYLSNRKQLVDIDGHHSEPTTIDISVIQGSILGPILFNIFINDLPSASNIVTFLFADDTQGLVRGNHLPTLITRLNTELRNWSSWFRANRLGVNVNKTKYLIFHNRGKRINLEGEKVLFDNNDPTLPHDPELVTELERICKSNPPSSQSYKLLGILFDENLTFKYHIDNLQSKLSKGIYLLNRVKNLLPQKALKSLYYAYIHSHLTYCPIILGCSPASDITKIFKLQKKAIRIISNSTYHAHTTPLFQNLQILPIHKIIQQSKLIFMHSYHYKYAPLSFINTWPTNNERNVPMDLRNQHDYSIPRSNTENFKRFPLYSIPFAWNNAGFFRNYNNTTTFKIALKNYLHSEECPEIPFMSNTLDIPAPPLPPPPPPNPNPPTQ